MTDELRIREAREEDRDEILDLLKASLGEGLIPRDADYWNWKHRSNPFGPSPALVAEARGQIVGLRVFMRWTWERGGERIPAVRAVDTATHPDWQGRGIFTRLTMSLLERLAAENVAFVFNTPNKFSRPGYLKMGWSAVGRVNMWVRPRRPLRGLARLIGRGYSPEERGADAQASIQGLLADPGLEHLLSSLREDRPRLRTERSRDYLQWRYGDIPGFRYDAAWTIGESAAAAVVYRHRDRGSLLELRVCEVLMGDGSESRDSAARLIRHVVSASDADYAVAMAAEGTPARGALVRAGFLPAPRLGPILTVRRLSEGKSYTDSSEWSLSVGDLEIF